MNLSSLLLGKPLTAITLQDLQSYFQTQQIESDKLEFKSFAPNNPGPPKDTEVNNILRSIAAFSNSDGGILIWGSPSGVSMPGQKEKAFQGQLTTTSFRYEKDAFISKIANRITPSPRGVLFHRVDVQGSFIYLFEIPQSEHAPHQFEHVYPMRLDGQTNPAPHAYIEALFKKVSFPKLGAYLRLDSLSPDNSDLVSLYCTLVFRNQSRYQNDEDLHYQVFCDHGRLKDLNSHFLSPIDSAFETGSTHSPGVISNKISFGNFLNHGFRLVLSRRKLGQVSNKVKLRVQIGARFSPMKLSYYTLFVPSELHQNKLPIIIDKLENIYFHENDELEGITDDQRLQATLNVQVASL